MFVKSLEMAVELASLFGTEKLGFKVFCDAHDFKQNHMQSLSDISDIERYRARIGLCRLIIDDYNQLC